MKTEERELRRQEGLSPSARERLRTCISMRKHYIVKAQTPNQIRAIVLWPKVKTLYSAGADVNAFCSFPEGSGGEAAIPRADSDESTRAIFAVDDKC